MSQRLEVCSNAFLYALIADTHSLSKGHMTSPVSPSLLDIFHEVPTLPELLNMDDQKALSAASRSFRRSFVAKIQLVTVESEQDLALVNQSWPLLSMVTLRHRRRSSDAILPSDRGLACVCVQVGGFGYSSEKIFMLKPLHTSSSLSVSASAAQQLAHHLWAKWRSLTLFSINDLELPAAGVAIIAQLASADCLSALCMNHLNLSHCGLATQDCLALSQGNWPALRTLELTHNRIDAEGMALLAKGKWSSLTTFQLSYNPALDAEAMTHLSGANWPLRCLELSHMPTNAARLAQLHLFNLASVTLFKYHIATAISELASADWPFLRVLDLGHNALDAAAMLFLCRIPVPVLTTLMLSNATITGAGACWLAQGSWPYLHSLNLSDNQLNTEAVRHIVSGVWPQLHSLSLEGNLFADDGLQQLTKGNWPLLNSLAISLNMLRRRDTVALFGLDIGQVQHLKSRVTFSNLEMLPRSDERLWPNLRGVQVAFASLLEVA